MSLNLFRKLFLVIFPIERENRSPKEALRKQQSFRQPTRRAPLRGIVIMPPLRTVTCHPFDSSRRFQLTRCPKQRTRLPERISFRFSRKIGLLKNCSRECERKQWEPLKLCFINVWFGNSSGRWRSDSDILVRHTGTWVSWIDWIAQTPLISAIDWQPEPLSFHIKIFYYFLIVWHLIAERFAGSTRTLNTRNLRSSLLLNFGEVLLAGVTIICSWQLFGLDLFGCKGFTVKLSPLLLEKAVRTFRLEIF